MVVITPQPPLARVTSNKRRRRMVAIFDLVAEHGSVSLAELSELLQVSVVTVRRYVADMADQRLLLRTHGGATALDLGTELPVGLRDTRFQAAKRSIARATAARLPSGHSVIALSGGTTTASVARELAYRKEITVLTNSLTIAGLLSAFPGVRVIMTGGFLRPQSLELVGAFAENTFNAVNVETAILGADGFSLSGGVTTHDEIEARANRAMAAKAQRTVVVADGSKVGRVAFAQMVETSQVAMLVTDSSADVGELSRIRDAGVEVVIADARTRWSAHAPTARTEREKDAELAKKSGRGTFS
jgi:DeoR family transcriptional regulator of aga operon